MMGDVLLTTIIVVPFPAASSDRPRTPQRRSEWESGGWLAGIGSAVGSVRPIDWLDREGGFLSGTREPLVPATVHPRSCGSRAGSRRESPRSWQPPCQLWRSITPNDQLGNLTPPIALAVDRPAGVYPLNLEASIQFTDERRVRVRQHHIHSAPRQPAEDVGQPALIVDGEAGAIVGSERRSCRQRMIRRGGKQENAPPGPV